MEKLIDLRSDTVTQPTIEMRQAMFDAVVGDDIQGDDPTVIKLEAMVAEMLDKEAGLFVCSGTMANEVAIMTFTNRGDEIILADNSQMFNMGAGGLAALSQVQTRTFSIKNGIYDVDLLESLIQIKGVQHPITSTICLENTNDLHKGLVVPKENIDEVCAMAKRHNLSVFLDGARLFNAEVASGIPAKDIVENCDAVMIALTKGLAAPFGSVLVGSKEFIEKARFHKQRLGGGFRQAGFMAAPAIVALQTMMPQLSIDHENARALGALLKGNKKLDINTDEIHTNIILGVLDDSAMPIDEFVEKLLAVNIKIKKLSKNSFRMITHYGIDMEDIKYVAAEMNKIL